MATARQTISLPASELDLKRFLDRIELCVGVFATTLWAIILTLVHVAAFFQINDHPVAPGVSTFLHGLVSACVLIQFWYVGLIWAAFPHAKRRIGPAVVAMQPKFPWPVRLLLSFLWLLQFLYGCGFILLLENFIHDPDSQIPPNLWIVRALVVFCCSYATYLYLVLAAGTLIPNQRLTYWLWRWRFAADALVTIGLLIHWRG